MAAIHRFTPIGLIVLTSSLLAAPGPPTSPAHPPQLLVTDAASACPVVDGRFVALLRADRGMLLLSSAPFEGGSRLGVATGARLRAAPPEGAAWIIDRIGRPGSQLPVFGAVYPFRATPVTGCVAFDKAPFGSEGDLVTYLQWLVEDVYARLPAAQRERFPAFLLDGRQVRLRVGPPGDGRIDLHGGEGSSLAFKIAGEERTFVLVPFVLDAGSGTVAIRVLAAAGSMWQSAPKDELGWLVASPSAPAELAAPRLVVEVAGVG